MEEEDQPLPDAGAGRTVAQRGDAGRDAGCEARRPNLLLTLGVGRFWVVGDRCLMTSQMLRITRNDHLGLTTVDVLFPQW